MPFYVLLSISYRFVCELDCIILPGWENPAAWQLLALARWRKIPAIAFYESTANSQRFRSGVVAWLRRIFFSKVSAVITVGAASADAVHTGMGVARSKIVVTHNAVDHESLFRGVSSDEAPSVERADDSTDRSRRILYVGQLISRKNVKSLISSLLMLDGSFLLGIVGEGPLESDLQELVSQSGLNSRVTFHGYVEPEQLASKFCECATLVLPSTEEVYGLVVLEALSFGLHVVVGLNVGVAPDIDGIEGVWVCDPSPGPLAVAISASAREWSGPIAEPRVLSWTAESMVGDVLHAVEIAGTPHRQTG